LNHSPMRSLTLSGAWRVGPNQNSSSSPGLASPVTSGRQWWPEQQAGASRYRVRPLRSALGSEQQPQDQADQRQKQQDQNPEHLGAGAGAARGGLDDGPDDDDQPDQAQKTGDFDSHDVSLR